MTDGKVQAAPKAIGERHAAARGGAQLGSIGPRAISMGAALFTDVRARDWRRTISIGQLAVPQWLPEVGVLSPSDPILTRRLGWPGY
jgi:hypothetical protein